MLAGWILVEEQSVLTVLGQRNVVGQIPVEEQNMTGTSVATERQGRTRRPGKCSNVGTQASWLLVFELTWQGVVF